MIQQGNETFEGYEKIYEVSVEAVKERVKKYFEEAWIYVVLDFAVGFGIYKDQSYLLKLDNEKKLLPLDWRYVQEMRIFNRIGELRISPIKGHWIGRFRGSILDCKENAEGMYGFIIDENQKLWGRFEKSEVIDSLQWSLLTSERGTRIWVPIELREHKEAAVCVRKFMGTPQNDSWGMAYQTDLRMVDFCVWKENIGRDLKWEMTK
ncbi:MAG: CRISPR-associated protein Csx19 [Eubacteriales bacterium]|nr:CRISPR-associated protein Csx19 [Eubacteriales bacterium]